MLEYERPDCLNHSLRILEVPYFEKILEVCGSEIILALNIWQYAIEYDVEPIYTYHKLYYLFEAFLQSQLATLKIFSQEYEDISIYPTALLFYNQAITEYSELLKACLVYLENSIYK